MLMDEAKRKAKDMLPCMHDGGSCACEYREVVADALLEAFQEGYNEGQLQREREEEVTA